ncbi:hypothetical protein B0T20DRAFT_449559 [Sordaria brevicollis]|uniref:Uncharacterized protein n=1 Tax=Sordaria brevicollis TaxID=83679 RepID=A0AAE0PM08_SORBR|nr:hypothetical protein B0T20DRAFT_449559 [Sordaria brevicollis]
MCTQTVLTTMLCRKCGSPMSNTTTTITTPCQGSGGGGGGGGTNSNSSNHSNTGRCPGTCPGAGKTITKTAKSGRVCGACTLEEVRIYTGSF